MAWSSHNCSPEASFSSDSMQQATFARNSISTLTRAASSFRETGALVHDRQPHVSMQSRFFYSAGELGVRRGTVRFRRQTQHHSRQGLDAQVLRSRHAQTTTHRNCPYGPVLMVSTSPFPGMICESVQHFIAVCTIHTIEPAWHCCDSF